MDGSGVQFEGRTIGDQSRAISTLELIPDTTRERSIHIVRRGFPNRRTDPGSNRSPEAFAASEVYANALQKEAVDCRLDVGTSQHGLEVARAPVKPITDVTQTTDAPAIHSLRGQAERSNRREIHPEGQEVCLDQAIQEEASVQVGSADAHRAAFVFEGGQRLVES